MYVGYETATFWQGCHLCQSVLSSKENMDRFTHETRLEIVKLFQGVKRQALEWNKSSFLLSNTYSVYHTKKPI